MDSSEKTVLKAQLDRIVRRLWKDFLVIADDIRQDHLAVLSEMKQFPPELLVRWNYLDLPKYSRIRKKVLDQGNDALREMEAILEHFEVSLDNNSETSKI
jgi:hypothetical protein